MWILDPLFAKPQGGVVGVGVLETAKAWEPISPAVCAL